MKIINYKIKNSQKGQILLITLVFMAIVTTMVVSLVGYAGIQIKAHRQALGKEQALNVAEAGAEMAIWKLNNQSGYTGETNTAYANGAYTVTITNQGSSLKLIKVDSYVPNAVNPVAHRAVQLSVGTSGTSNIIFQYGVQADSGGFAMDNNSKITGDVYANGPIVGANGTSITGDVVSITSISKSDITGNANSDSIDHSEVSGNSNQHTKIWDTSVSGNASTALMTGPGCRITGIATYNTNSGCTFLGPKVTPNNNVPVVPAAILMPISADNITSWEQEATAGGVMGSQTIATSSLGPVKINGNLTVNGTLTITGTIWVTGSITVNNGGTVKLSASYGGLTGILMAGTNGSATNGAITISNNATVAGSGATGSYLLVLSEMNSTSNYAINVNNNALSAIIYAGTGVVNVLNNAQLREVTGYKIHLNNNVILTSEVGANASYFSSGSSGGWQIQDQTWQLLQ